MFWYTVLMVLGIIFGLATAAAILFLIIDPSMETALIFIIVFAIAIGSFIGTEQIEKTNTVVYTEVVEMEITKCDIAGYRTPSMNEQTHFYLTVGNEYVIKVSSKEYAELNVGDTVLVEVETKTTFGETTETARLK